MIKWLLGTNLFVLACGILQAMGAAWYYNGGKPKFALLYFLYALTNFVIWWMKGE